jgi:hypothetical protein
LRNFRILDSGDRPHIGLGFNLLDDTKLNAVLNAMGIQDAAVRANTAWHH